MKYFTPIEYLHIDIANCYGLGRNNWEDRLEWTADNLHDLEAQDADAKHPILYRKAVRALRLVEAGQTTNHIMGLDASASGLQIMAAMMGCHVSATAVNLVNTGNCEDIYENMASYMRSKGAANVTREDAKSPVMTTFYGSTAVPRNAFGDGTSELKLFYQALLEKLPGAYELMLLIQGQWRADAHFYEWTLPDGHVAHVPVTQVVDQKIEVDEWDHMQFVQRMEITKNQVRGRSLAANVVHSMDAWVARSMVTMASKQGFWLAPIHDCFYASPKYMNQVRANYVELLRWIANGDRISPIMSQIMGKPVTVKRRSNDLGRHIAEAEYPLS